MERDEEYDQPMKPPPRDTFSLQAEAHRRKRLTLDDIDIENIEDGTVIETNIDMKPTSEPDHTKKAEEMFVSLLLSTVLPMNNNFS